MIENTICALATPTGGAIAIVRLSGPQAIQIADSVFSRDIRNVPANSVIYGNIVSTEVIDDVLLTVFRAPHSYTGEDSVEISCHGSAYIAQTIINLLIAKGCTLAAPGEFTRRAFLAGKMDLSQAEAVADLIASQNAATHRIAIHQLKGGLSSELAQLRERLLHLTSLMELELDFSDHEELEFADRTELRELSHAILAHIMRLADSFRLGNALKQGVPVAIIGAPNVGKSTLLNALLGEEKAIVSDIQGTTRDLIEDTITLGNITFRFIDTAGIRHTDDRIELLGIERSRQAASRAQIIILMNEPGVNFPEVDLRDDQTVIRITNKTAEFQALHGIGLNALRQQLISAVPQVSEDQFVVTNLRHYEALVRAKDSLQRVIDGMQMSVPNDLLSEDLRDTLSHLAEITGGQITTDEVLGNIFKNFCIGK